MWNGTTIVQDWSVVLAVGGAVAGQQLTPNAPIGGTALANYSGPGHRGISVEVRGVLYGPQFGNAVGLETDCKVRMVIVRDWDNNQNYTDANVLFSSGTTTINMYEFFNVNNMGRFSILYDHVYDMSGSGNEKISAATNPRTKSTIINIKIPCGGVLRTSNSGEGYTSLRKGAMSIWMCYYSSRGPIDSTGAGYQVPKFVCNTRYCFYETH